MRSLVFPYYGESMDAWEDGGRGWCQANARAPALQPHTWLLLLTPSPVLCAVLCAAVGLVSSLVQQGVLTRPAHLAGSSAGSLIAASFNAGRPAECARGAGQGGLGETTAPLLPVALA
jgi:hypothetical protein